MVILALKYLNKICNYAMYHVHCYPCLENCRKKVNKQLTESLAWVIHHNFPWCHWKLLLLPAEWRWTDRVAENLSCGLTIKLSWTHPQSTRECAAPFYEFPRASQRPCLRGAILEIIQSLVQWLPNCFSLPWPTASESYYYGVALPPTNNPPPPRHANSCTPCCGGCRSWIMPQLQFTVGYAVWLNWASSYLAICLSLTSPNTHTRQWPLSTSMEIANSFINLFKYKHLEWSKKFANPFEYLKAYDIISDSETQLRTYGKTTDLIDKKKRHKT